MSYLTKVKTAKCLRYNNSGYSNPFLGWNLLKYASSARLRQYRHPDMDETAFEPSPDRIHIFPELNNASPWLYWIAQWGPIVIEKRDEKPISVGNVLDAIYAYFRQPLTKEEQILAKKTPGNDTNLLQAMELRAAEGPEVRDYVMSRPSRVDLLGKIHWFWGMRHSSRQYPDGTIAVYLGLASL
ncbi:hypothetical protein C8J56DRAFT_1114064 [Mycena floridula]|nr:hypothetical protein C8J56DRAFT_1114064 [Mycena floridula]